MITFFTTFKDFKGKNRINQFNAIRSWLALGKDIEVIIFSESEGVETVLTDPRIKYIKDVQLHDDRIPLIGPMFNEADRISKHKICCFINGDIIVTELFKNTLIELDQKLKKNYLLVGQKANVDVNEELVFDKGWEARFHQKHAAHYEEKLHGMDYFVFPKGQYANYKFPTLLVGRVGWDLWMVYHARLEKIKSVDITPTIKPIHQNHDYKHKINNKAKRAIEDNINFEAFPAQKFHFFTPKTSAYIYENQQIKRNFAGGDIETYLRTKLTLSENKIISKFLLMLVAEKSIFANTLTKNIGTNLFKLLAQRQLL